MDTQTWYCVKKYINSDIEPVEVVRYSQKSVWLGGKIVHRVDRTTYDVAYYPNYEDAVLAREQFLRSRINALQNELDRAVEKLSAIIDN